jgi:hypothetical protein
MQTNNVPGNLRTRKIVSSKLFPLLPLNWSEYEWVWYEYCLTFIILNGMSINPFWYLLPWEYEY